MGILNKYYHRLTSSPELQKDQEEHEEHSEREHCETSINASIHGFIPIPDDELEIISITMMGMKRMREESNEDGDEDEEVIGTTAQAPHLYGINVNNVMNHNTNNDHIIIDTTTTNNNNTMDNLVAAHIHDESSSSSPMSQSRFKATTIIHNRSFKIAMWMLLALTLTFITVSGVMLGVGLGTDLLFRQKRRGGPSIPPYHVASCPGARENTQSMNHPLAGITTLKITGRGAVKIITTPMTAPDTVRIDVKSLDNKAMMVRRRSRMMPEESPKRFIHEEQQQNNDNGGNGGNGGSQAPGGAPWENRSVRSALFVDRLDPSVLVLNTESREEMCSKVIARFVMLPLGAQNLRIVFESVDPFESSMSANVPSVEFVQRRRS